MKSPFPSSPDRGSQAKPKPVGKTTNASEKRLQASTQNPNRLKIVKTVYAGHVRGGHAFH